MKTNELINLDVHEMNTFEMGDTIGGSGLSDAIWYGVGFAIGITVAVGEKVWDAYGKSMSYQGVQGRAGLR